MSPGEKQRVAHVVDEISDPLAAMRCALFLADAHSEHGKAAYYLTVAEQQAFSIVGILRHVVHTDEERDPLGDISLPERSLAALHY